MNESYVTIVFENGNITCIENILQQPKKVQNLQIRKNMIASTCCSAFGVVAGTLNGLYLVDLE